MLVQTQKLTTHHVRTSKLGKTHAYSRTKTLVVLQCDQCYQIFNRELGNMDHKRVQEGYVHVCSKCNPKQFAQLQGVKQRRIWSMSADSDFNISKG